ncbi:hypothetical protein ID866_8189 [Astraeus odoratus]|nr:hypothetical protein ID866_8189 [Astraeus odoratus]
MACRNTSTRHTALRSCLGKRKLHACGGIVDEFRQGTTLCATFGKCTSGMQEVQTVVPKLRQIEKDMGGAIAISHSNRTSLVLDLCCLLHVYYGSMILAEKVHDLH